MNTSTFTNTGSRTGPAGLNIRQVRILLVDDEAGFREMAAEHLESIGMEVEQAGGSEDALQILRNRTFDVAVFDLRMPGLNGIDLLKKVKPEAPEMEILILTANAGVETAVEAMRLGAHHYLVKPVKLAELQVALERASEKARLNRLKESETAVREHRKHYRHGEFLALGPQARAVLEKAEQAAAGAFPVLIQGETGTGKELIAQWIHRSSPKTKGPLVAVNCGLLSDTLLERELFGHARGAFTGAVESRAGLFEAADAGTLLLDEIGESSPSVQVALLRAIETGMFRRIGETRERFADVRIVAASNCRLSLSVEAGTFRADLFHRLNVVDILIPPLRERPEEIAPLAKTFLSRMGFSGELSTDAAEALTAYDWPGNVRELQNVIERAVFAARPGGERERLDRPIQADMLGLVVAARPVRAEMDLDSAERAHILATLDHLRGDKPAAAKALGISLRHLYRKIKKYKLPV